MKHVDMIVSGTVQGVGFRNIVRKVAVQFSLKGEVENLENGTVRIACEGMEEDIAKFIGRIRSVDYPITIDDIQTEYSDPRGEYKNTFRIITGDLAQEMFEGFATGYMYLDKIAGEIRSSTKTLSDKQDQMIDKQDQTIAEIRSSTKTLSDKQDQTIAEIRSSTKTLSDKQDQTTKEIRAHSINNREMLDSRFEKIEKDITKIKTKLEI